MRIQILRRTICTSSFRKCSKTSVAPSVIRKPTKEVSNDENQTFVDYLKIRVKGGDGGNGALSLLSVKYKEFAGPDGGNGGNGGHLIFQASKQVNSLGHLKPEMRAEDGVPGSTLYRPGKNASHKIVQVPVGTVFRNLDREIVAELVKEDSMFLAARGGVGGKGNSFFRSAERQTPLSSELGGQGENFTFDVEMRTIADVGLVGFPNAGKSTLLRAISRARPKVAAYPFTTLRPHIGMVPFEDGSQLAVADIPGIIEDAHRNKGLGISFLRHIERCRCLLYVIDMSSSDGDEQIEALAFELEQFSPGLSKRPHGIIANKMDLDESVEHFKKFEDWLKAQKRDLSYLFPISAKENINVRPLLHFIKKMSDRDS